MPAKKATAKKKATPKKKATAKKKATTRASSKPKTTPAHRAETPSRRGSAASGRSGDLIIIDSTQVGSPPREGEVLEVIQAGVSVSYRVRWADGHETLIAPKSGTARIVRAAKKG